ncbi:leucine-rich repeat-containing protein 71 isoform X1 [Seriola lalandi dorsalis]|uniref:leucine-rich repeat-containing protein 71 isoform X1 n=1 Tax=Seriola lalandi dorsalis TaxID=1841481 RepID=UPI000C6F9A1C|nr:leucine-rich repeat-containing protein 71 isoform X1 [Seriola lalandi dorsalis]
MSRKKHVKDKTEKANAEDEKNTGQAPNETSPAQTFDGYQCSGKVEIDFPGLCALLNIKDIPAVSTKQPASSILTETEGGDVENRQSQKNAVSFWSKSCLQVELENEDPLSAKSMTVSGWKVDEPTTRVLQKILPSLSQLQNLQFWQAGLTDQMVISLMNTISLCSNLRVVKLEGNPLPEKSYHHLLSEDSILTHLSLRNNRMGDESARLIGAALSTKRSSNTNLLSLNLAFNSIGDAGAAHIAQGLRLNRALLFLSLSNNQIGDTGAAHLAAILSDFALTHEEVVERRKLLLEKAQSSTPAADSDQTPADQLPSVPNSTTLSVSKGENKGTSKKKEASKKDEKPAANKENPKSNKKSSDVKAHQTKGGKPGGKEKQLTAQEDQSSAALNEQVELVEIRNPLLEQSLQHRDGELFLPGNTTLTSLNLTGNRITEKSLPLFLTSLEMQGEGGGLLRLCMQRNRFPPECESYMKIEELIALRHQRKKRSEEAEEEGQGA